MRINTIKPAPGSKRPRLRVGRGASAGQGKTCGRGVKGQRARKNAAPNASYRATHHGPEARGSMIADL